MNIAGNNRLNPASAEVLTNLSRTGKKEKEIIV
jgi:hypothetical protein